jgi:hypothetical protein
MIKTKTLSPQRTQRGAEGAGKTKKKKRCHPEGRQERALSSARE